MQQHTIVWRGVKIEITFTPKAFGMVDHIELRTEGKAPFPVAETGYRSHFTHKGAVAEYGGEVAFVTAWLDHEAERTGWRGAQRSLF